MLEQILEQNLSNKFDTQLKSKPFKSIKVIELDGEFSLTYWIENNNFYIGTLESYKKGNGTKVVDSLKHSTIGKYRIIANKTESVGFWQKQGFTESWDLYPDYEFTR